jgi:DNA helicase-2/ATP-dependent DNA helicase PcrA
LYALDEGIPPERIALLAFTRNAAAEMKQRLGMLLDDPDILDKLSISTFHSLAQQELRKHSPLIGIPSDFKVYTGKESKYLCQQILSNESTTKWQPVDGVPEGLNLPAISATKLAKWIGLQKGLGKRPMDTYQHFQGIADPLGLFRNSFWRQYQEELEKAQALDFGDLILQYCGLLYRFPGLSEQYDLLLVDEFQGESRL